MNRRERLAAIAKAHDAWQARVRGVRPDPRYANNDPSQYTESIQDVSASAIAQAAYVRAVESELRKLG